MADEVVEGEVVEHTPVQGALAPTPREYVYVPSLSVEQLVQLLEKVQQAKERVLKEGINNDYAVIPGTGNKPSLLKPGAEKLCQLFGYRIGGMDRMETQETPFGVLYKCTICDPNGRIVGVCDGWADKGEAKASRWDKNTVIKMAQKRAFVGATLWACNASAIFTQDVEDYGTDTTDDFGTVRESPPRRSTPSSQRLSDSDAGVSAFESLVGFWKDSTGVSRVEAEEFVIAACKNCGYESTDDLSVPHKAALVRAKLAEELEAEKRAKQPSEKPPKTVAETPGTLILKKLIEDYGKRLDKDSVWSCIKQAGINTIEELSEEGAYEMVVTYLDEKLEESDSDGSDS